MQKIIEKGNRAVIINDQDGHFWANLYVNTQNGLGRADITAQRWTGKTMNGAIRWANKNLEV